MLDEEDEEVQSNIGDDVLEDDIIENGVDDDNSIIQII